MLFNASATVWYPSHGYYITQVDLILIHLKTFQMEKGNTIVLWVQIRDQTIIFTCYLFF